MVKTLDSRSAPVARQDEGEEGGKERRREGKVVTMIEVILAGRKPGGITRLRARDWVLRKCTRSTFS